MLGDDLNMLSRPSWYRTSTTGSPSEAKRSEFATGGSEVLLPVGPAPTTASEQTTKKHDFKNPLIWGAVFLTIAYFSTYGN